MKLSEITLTLGQVATVFQNVTMSEPTLRMWHKLFENEDSQRFQAAIIAIIKEPGRVFFPTPGEVVAMLQRMNEGDNAPGDLWEMACLLARGGLNTEQMVERMSETSPRAARALRSIGWDRVRYTDNSELHYVRREFLEALAAYEQFEHEQTTRLEATSVLSKIAASIGSANGGRLAGLPSMVGKVQTPSSGGSDGNLCQGATQKQREIPEA